MIDNSFFYRTILLHKLFMAFLVVSSTSASYVDLNFDLKLKHVPQECRAASTVPPRVSNDSADCRLSYAISVLQSFGDFDLNAVMLQEGHVDHVNGDKHHFREDTLVAIPTSIRREEEGSVYVGVRIYGLPKFVQDYFLIDVTKLFRHPSSKSVTTVEADDLSFTTVAKYGKITHFHKNDNENCVCNSQSRTCKCCATVNTAKIGLSNQTACVNLTYLPNGVGLFVQFYFNQQLVYNRTTTIEDSKPMCFQTTSLKEYANLCLRIGDINIDESSSLGGCVRLDSELYHIRISTKEMGCFRYQSTLTT